MKKNKLLSFDTNLFKKIIVFLFLLFLPTQIGKHFFLNFSYISGVKIDYLSLIFYLTDFLAVTLIILNFHLVTDYLKKQSKVFFIFFILFFVNILFSRYPVLAFYHLLKTVEFLSIFIIFKNSKFSQSLVMIPLMLGGVVEFILALLQFFYKSSLQGIFYFLGERYLSLNLPDIAKATINGIEILRPYATFSHPNSMAGFYLLLYFYFLTKPPGLRSPETQFGVNSVGKPRGLMTMLIKYISLLIFSFLILISFSKTAIVVYLLLNIVHLVIKRGECKFCPFSSGIVFLIVSMIFLQSANDPLSFYKRLVLFFNSLEIISKNLLFGTGAGHYLYYQAGFAIKYNYFFLQPVHNIFLLFFAQMGILISGFVFFLLLNFLKKNLRSLPFLFCCLVFLLTGMMDHYWLTLQQNWLLLGVVFGLSTVSR